MQILSAVVAAVLAVPPWAAARQDRAPQEPAVPDLEQLARRVESAHRPEGPVPEVTAFRSNLELHLLDASAEHGGQVDLAVQFLLQPRAKKKPLPLIRYELRGGDVAAVRGRDENGPWQLFRGEPRDLFAAEFAQDLAAFERHTNLARQLLRFLSPGQVLRSLEQPSQVTAADLVLNERRGLRVPALQVRGRLAAFPLLQKAGEDGPVELTIWIERDSGRLLAVDAAPLVDGEPVEARGERVLLLDLKTRDGLLVPHRLEHLFRDREGQLRLQSRAMLTTLALRPDLTVADFARSTAAAPK